MEGGTTPRVNGKYINNYVGQMVCLIGEVGSGANGNEAVVRASDGVDIQVMLPPGEMFDSKYVQIIGKVVQNNTINGFSVNSVSNNFHMDNYDKLVELWNGQYQNLFM